MLISKCLTQDIYAAWQELNELAVKRTVLLDEAEKAQQRLDELRLQYAKQAAVCVFLFRNMANFTRFVAALEQLVGRVD